MFASLSEKIQKAFKHLSGSAYITEVNVSSVVKDIRKALLDADVHYKIAKEFTDRVKKRAIGKEVIGSLRPDQVMVKVMQDELTDLLGGTATELSFKGSPCIILIAGLQGAGKTTFCAKLAKFLQKKKQLSSLLVAADTRRPAAIEQLKTLGERIGQAVYAEEGNPDPEPVIKNALKKAKEEKKSLLIIDTSGRQSVDIALMQELSHIKNTFRPQHTFFVIDAMMGQASVETAKAFHETLDLTGVVLSKLDGDSRGGAALSVKYTIGRPIVYVSKGEHLEDMEAFHPDRLAGRILGMGDITSLVERAEALFDKEQAQKLEQKIKKNKFDFEDFLEQMRAIEKMGNMQELLSMVPGVGQRIKDMPFNEKRWTGVEAIIQSMTPTERRNPQLIDKGRQERIAKGAGRAQKEVADLLKQFAQMRKIIQQMNSGRTPFKMPFRS